jgi:hypothetical protein
LSTLFGEKGIPLGIPFQKRGIPIPTSEMCANCLT